MGKRLNIENPFYSGNASASAFGWQFQVDAAIFLFIHYIDEIERITVEGKYQDIELACRDGKKIYAQAKSVYNGSNDHRKKKMEDAIISLAKTPYDKECGDKLVYISNYDAPIKKSEVYNKSVVKLQNVKPDKEEFKKQIDKIIEDLEKTIIKEKGDKKKKYEELVKRIKGINVDDFLMSSIYPYIEAEDPMDTFRIIQDKITELLTVKFNIQSVYLQKFVQRLLVEWHQTFLFNATTSVASINKTMSKDALLWQIVVILSEIDINVESLFDEQIDLELLEEYETAFAKTSHVHERFSFFNKLIVDLKEYKRRTKKTEVEFIRENWKKYETEFAEYNECSIGEKEYLIKRSLYRLISSKNNIKKIIEGIE